MANKSPQLEYSIPDFKLTGAEKQYIKKLSKIWNSKMKFVDERYSEAVKRLSNG